MLLKYSPAEDDGHMDNHSSKKMITASRLRLGNPYAFVDDTGAYSAQLSEPLAVPTQKERVSASRKLLQDPYAHLDDRGEFTAAHDGKSVHDEAFPTLRPKSAVSFASLRKGVKKGARYSNAEIEQKAIELQKKMWRDKDRIWPGAMISDPIDILDPSVAFKLIGFDYDIVETLGQYFSGGKHVEVAGQIDDTGNQVWISQQFTHDVRNFTAAHELGHALLHDARGLHRDRPLDGSAVARDKVEFEADKFATYFLMPEKLVRARFASIFCTHQFYLDEETSFALTRGKSLNVTELRSLSRILASTESYNGIRFRSLSSQFGVSVEAMAIRLEELGLVTY